MDQIRLIHWKAEEALGKALILQAQGYDVDFSVFNRAGLKVMKSRPPQAVVIDLSRLPSQGRDVGLGLRMMKPLRNIPLVFVGGDPAKVGKIKEILPDAVYTDWDHILKDLGQALENPLQHPIVPRSNLDGYSGTPLPKKLGIKADISVALINAPDDFLSTLGELPRNVKIRSTLGGKPDLVLWFTDSRRKLEKSMDGLKQTFGKGGIWIIWPKKTSGVPSDLSQALVRKIGLASGLVDYKVCSVDRTWSGLKFTRRRT